MHAKPTIALIHAHILCRIYYQVCIYQNMSFVTLL